MNQIPLEQFLNRVLTNRERVHFTAVDPYGHLNANRYLEFLINHRMVAGEEQLQCNTMDIARDLKVGFVMADVHIKYLSPSLLGEELEIASWVTGYSAHGFNFSAVISGIKSKKAKAIAKVELVSVSLADGRITAMPTSMPSRSDADLLSDRPMKIDYLAALRGIPEGFL